MKIIVIIFKLIQSLIIIFNNQNNSNNNNNFKSIKIIKI